MPRLSKIGAAALAAFGWTGLQSVTASYLVVAGGGGGGSGWSGGGGAGGYQTGSTSLNPTLSYTVTVGAGGSASGSNTSGGTGNNSQFGSLTASVGGGSGGGGNAGGGNGGSGGGAGSGGATGSATIGGTATAGQGNNGGNSASASNYGPGGGGGAGAVGGTGTTTVAGNGGIGLPSSISGTSTYYAGGGGGGGISIGITTPGTGGTGGGGAGANSTTTGFAGTSNTGGGGGGGGYSGGWLAGGKGGSGVVIISYPAPQQFGGGVVTTSGSNVIHTFNTSGTLSPLSSLTASYLVVAGGGAGGVNQGGGGGAGGLLTGSGLTIDTNSNYVVVVGAGATQTGNNATTANGSNSSFSMVTTVALGGGGAGGYTTAGASGGSGGGGGGANGSASSYAGGAGTSGQGFAGGTGTQVGVYTAGGGGGSSAVGANSTASVGGNGGAGTASSISGTSVTYAGGGGGGVYAPAGQTPGSGGAGGGGTGGGTTGAVAGTNGTAGLGGGGGGGAGSGGLGGNGGSGVVIISYAGSTQQMAGGTVTITGGNVIHTFTSSGYLTPIKYVNNSLRLRSSASANLNRTPSVASNRKTWTWSAWVKRGTLNTNGNLFGGAFSTASDRLLFEGSDRLWFIWNDTTDGELLTTQVFRDPSAWYHIVCASDTTQATASNRMKFYVNGVQITTFTTATYPTQNRDGGVNNTTVQKMGVVPHANSQYLDGYLTEINFIDGQALTPNSFGTINSYGVWQPITYGGSYGTNGFYLPFTNTTSATTLAYDFSPNGNNWTPNNISTTAGSTYDSMTDVPTLTSATAANYCTWNPLVAGTSSYLSNGNLTASISASNTNVLGTMQLPTSGKFYWEYQITTIASSGAPMGGIASSTTTSPAVFYRTDANKIVDGTQTSYGATYTTTDTIGVAVDVTGGTVVFYKNNTSQGSITYASSGLFPALRSNAGTDVFNVNFGQRPFTYTPPTGFVALNTYNL